MIEPFPVSRDNQVVPATHAGTREAFSREAVTAERSSGGGWGRAVIWYGRIGVDPHGEGKILTRRNRELRPRSFPWSAFAVEVHGLPSDGRILQFQFFGDQRLEDRFSRTCNGVVVLPRIFREVSIEAPLRRVALSTDAFVGAAVAVHQVPVVANLRALHELISTDCRAGGKIFERDGCVGGARSVDGNIGTVSHPFAGDRALGSAVLCFAGIELRYLCL